MAEPKNDLARTTIGVLFIAVFVGFSLFVLRPFVLATVWATMLVVTTWPLLLRLQRRLWNRRGAAVAVLTVVLLLVLVVPLTVVVARVASSTDRFAARIEQLQSADIPPPPEWVAGVPLVGSRIATFWQETASRDIAEIRQQLMPYAGKAARWLLAEAGAVGGLLVQFLLTVIIAAILYANGESAVAGIVAFSRRLAGDNGEASVVLAGQAIRGVAMGVVVTALVQTTLGAIGLAIAGVPFVTVLAVIMLLLCIAQVGPALVVFPATAWVFYSDGAGWGTFLLVWSLVVVTLDNVLRPILIKLGADLPLLLIFAGVIGGLLAFGLVGVFVGPVMLAVTYTLLEAWVKGGAATVAAAPSPPPEAASGK
jgi:predicted PurR-regulated permease PerM